MSKSHSIIKYALNIYMCTIDREANGIDKNLLQSNYLLLSNGNAKVAAALKQFSKK